MMTEVIHDAHTIVHATGEVDLSNVTEFGRALDEGVERSPKGFIIDLSEVAYIDSAGVQAILAAYAKMREPDGCLIAIVANSRVRTVLDVVHLDHLAGVCVCEELEAARKSLSQ